MKLVPKNYPPALFHSKDVKEAFYIASRAKFASIFLLDHPQQDIVFAPFFNLYEAKKETTFYAHLVKTNPLFDLLKSNKILKCRLVFQQSDMYISPAAFAEKKISHRVVPTWNYVGAQFLGELKLSHEENLEELLLKESQIFETDIESDWRLSDAPKEYVEGLKKAIFGVKVDVSDWTTHKKLSQNKPKHQVENIKNWCKKQQEKEKNIINWMEYFESSN